MSDYSSFVTAAWSLTRILYAVLVIVMGGFSVGLVGCARPPVAPSGVQPVATRRVESAEQIARRLDLTLARPPTTRETTIPPTLDDAQWATMQIAALQGGYDLNPYAGRPVTIRSFKVVEKSEGSRQTLSLIESGSKVIGAFISVEGVDPGVSGVGNPS